MTATRNISKIGPISGQTHVDTMADTVNELVKYVAGNAISPSGTNALSFTIGLMNGLTGIPDGLELDIIHPLSNTGPMTLEITGTGTGAKAARKPDGTAFSGGEIIGGTSYKWKFWGSEDHWRLVGTVNASGAGAKYPLVFTRIFATPGAWTWTAPWDCDVDVVCLGAGGGGTRGGGASNHNSAGGAGGMCRKFTFMNSGDVISGAVGAGGAEGTAGGTTTVTSTDIAISMSASGGGGGIASGGTTPVAGGAGGTASGGDVNYTGGAGFSTTAGGNNNRGAGGAPGLTGTGITGGPGSNNPTYANNTGVDVVPFSYGENDGGAGGNDNSNADNGGKGAGGGSTTGSGNAGVGGNGFVVVRYSADKSA